MMQAFDQSTGRVDVQNVNKLQPGMTIERLAKLSRSEIEYIISNKTHGSWDGEWCWGSNNNQAMVWVKFELKENNGSMTLINHSLGYVDTVGSLAHARRIIRSY